MLSIGLNLKKARQAAGMRQESVGHIQVSQYNCF